MTPFYSGDLGYSRLRLPLIASVEYLNSNREPSADVAPTTTYYLIYFAGSCLSFNVQIRRKGLPGKTKLRESKLTLLTSTWWPASTVQLHCIGSVGRDSSFAANDSGPGQQEPAIWIMGVHCILSCMHVQYRLV